MLLFESTIFRLAKSDASTRLSQQSIDAEMNIEYLCQQLRRGLRLILSPPQVECKARLQHIQTFSVPHNDEDSPVSCRAKTLFITTLPADAELAHLLSTVAQTSCGPACPLQTRTRATLSRISTSSSVGQQLCRGEQLHRYLFLATHFVTRRHAAAGNAADRTPRRKGRRWLVSERERGDAKVGCPAIFTHVESFPVAQARRSVVYLNGSVGSATIVLPCCSQGLASPLQRQVPGVRRAGEWARKIAGFISNGRQH